MSKRQEPRCKTCDGLGYVFRVPPRVNPFLCRIEVLEKVTRRIQCRDCKGENRRGE